MQEVVFRFPSIPIIRVAFPVDKVLGAIAAMSALSKEGIDKVLGTVRTREGLRRLGDSRRGRVWFEKTNVEHVMNLHRGMKS